jgi:hypothetical protein
MEHHREPADTTGENFREILLTRTDVDIDAVNDAPAA